MWKGSAAVCINSDNKLLMVLQGGEDEQKLWSVPSGKMKDDETYEECCIREASEETGYEVKAIREIFEKNSEVEGIKVKVQYFEVEIIGGELQINDPDGLIYDVQWKSYEDIETLDLSFPEDRKFLLEYISR